jgi:hypothetical protein
MNHKPSSPEGKSPKGLQTNPANLEDREHLYRMLSRLQEASEKGKSAVRRVLLHL